MFGQNKYLFENLIQNMYMFNTLKQIYVLLNGSSVLPNKASVSTKQSQTEQLTRPRYRSLSLYAVLSQPLLEFYLLTIFKFHDWFKRYGHAEWCSPNYHILLVMKIFMLSILKNNKIKLTFGHHN